MLGVPYPTRRTQHSRLLVVPQESGYLMGVLTSVGEVHLYDMPCPTQGAQLADVRQLPQEHGSDVGILASRRRLHVHELSRAPGRTQWADVHEMPFDRPHMGLLAPGCRLNLHQLPHSTRTALLGQLRELPRRCHFVGIQASELFGMRLVSPDTGQPLRDLVLVLPHARQVVLQRDVQPPGGAGRQAYVPQFLMHIMSSRGILQRELHKLSRGRRR